MFDFIIQKDQELLIFFNSLGSEQWDPFWLAITKQFNWAPLFLFVIILIFKFFGWKRGSFVILSLIILVAFSDQFVNLIKNTIERLRPNNNPEINHIIRTFSYSPKGFSFVSGHATTSTFFSVFVILLLRDKFKYIYFILIFPLLFSFSRMYLGVHFPLDVTMGALIGFILANLYYLLFNKVDQKLFANQIAQE
ncbi:phosphatase PAP2 family protein [Polaribacter reichenbachii]|uniref:Phosphoesterase n=1 Tax=Polaribacter reichenbachii TaxID=996801 RepID=A0A1B8TPE8_9FLAO|nr:phosphatase PAP2 family protein [Polaribacter reichenbachii]APZ46982.1 phosphatase PAP2 family protein [Polaribacter reichenbachii]AUC17625.1 phosphatase PAP2 family protein [Polaribacter reichenbachii]OBY61503.1 phosphoesterase [Polaribacter reichenbachii]